MCFYDQYKFQCDDFRWGNFRQHCNKEYRRGETCGMKLVHEVVHKHENCSLCEKIATKTRRFLNYQTKINQWKAEGREDELRATIEKYEQDQADVHRAIMKLNSERSDRAKAIGRYVKSGNPAAAYAGHNGGHGYAYPQQPFPPMQEQPQAYASASNGYQSYGNGGYGGYETSSNGYSFGFNT